MSPWAFIIEVLSKLPEVISATSRLVKATKETEPTPPLVTGDEALEYLRGANNQAERIFQRERIDAATKDMGKDEPFTPEEPGL